ncbi:MAG TPA: hypothetical protein VKR52_05635 [Terracidiphilus sp.]|nr:hypothetical protein [Terracidiphilus sp.]
MPAIVGEAESPQYSGVQTVHSAEAFAEAMRCLNGDDGPATPLKNTRAQTANGIIRKPLNDPMKAAPRAPTEHFPATAVREGRTKDFAAAPRNGVRPAARDAVTREAQHNLGSSSERGTTRPNRALEKASDASSTAIVPVGLPVFFDVMPIASAAMPTAPKGPLSLEAGRGAAQPEKSAIELPRQREKDREAWDDESSDLSMRAANEGAKDQGTGARSEPEQRASAAMKSDSSPATPGISFPAPATAIHLNRDATQAAVPSEHAAAGSTLPSTQSQAWQGMRGDAAKASKHPDSQPASQTLQSAGLVLPTQRQHPVLSADAPASSAVNIGSRDSGFASIPGSPAGQAITAADRTPTTVWTHAGPRQAEAGYQDEQLGWVAVRAQMGTDGIHATLVPDSAESAQALTIHLAGLSAHLMEQRMPVSTLALSYSDPSGGHTGMGPGGGQANDQARQPPPREASVARFAGRISEAGLSSAAAGLMGGLPEIIPGGGTYVSVIA